ncbi:MAG: carbon-nitrogen hydrolase family protein [Labilithrix sp.]
MLAPLFGWIVLTPIALLALERSPGEAAIAAAITGALASSSTCWSRTLRHLIPLSAIPGALSWGACTWLVAWLVPSPWFVVAFPAAMVVATLPLRLIGAPQFVNNPLARTQERWLFVVHTARFGGDLTTTGLLATAGASLALGIRGDLLPAAAGGAIVASMLTLGYASYRRAIQGVARAHRLRVAAVVVDGEPPADGELTGLWPGESAEYRDVAGTLARYRSHVEAAARDGASLIVLPEASAWLLGDDRAHFCREVQAWASRLEVTIVAPYFDATTPKNMLLVIDRTGVVGSYEKQHPARGIEPPCTTKMAVGPFVSQGGLAVSTAICVDLDYADTARSARTAGVVLAAPSNDWHGRFALMHHRSAVWAAVVGGVPIVRATGHGISAIYDSAGRVVGQQTSADGPVVLVGEVSSRRS